MDLRDVAADLYGVAPADFVAARATAAAGADGGLRGDIKALRKPTAAAAAVNALTRRDPALIDRILALGDRMRDAFATRDRDAIRELTLQRQRLLQTALRSLDASPAVGREVEETLQAAVIDPAAAAAVRSGMLVRALESTGVESVDISEAVAVPLDESELIARPRPSSPDPEQEAEPTPAPEAASPESASERRERQRAVRAAERALERARSEADALDDELDTEVDRRADLEAERASLDRRLQRTEAELAESKAAERALRKRIPELQRAVRDAERELGEARGD
jgi:hypothetical protein